MSIFKKKIKKTLLIEGMRCGGCEKNVQKHLLEIDGIVKVTASHINKNAEVIMEKEISDNEFKKVIEELGFQLIEVK